MVQVLYADKDILVAVKPAGVESQAAKRFAPDMVSEIRKYLVIHKLCTPGKEPYVGVIHRLDKPVLGVMVYALSKNAAAALSRQVQDRKLEKIYGAVVCGKPEKDVDKLVDYLEKSVDGNESYVVDHGGKCGKRAELSYEALESLEDGGNGIPDAFTDPSGDRTPPPDPGPVCIQGPAALWGPEIRNRSGRSSRASGSLRNVPFLCPSVHRKAHDLFRASVRRRIFKI